MRAYHLALSSLLFCLSVAVPAGEPTLQRLVADSDDVVRVLEHPTTGKPRFLRIAPGSLSLTGVTAKQRSTDFLQRYGQALGIADPGRQVRLLDEANDRLGHTKLSYEQRHEGLPVFAGIVRTHFDAEGRLVAVNGTFVPDVAVSTTPAWTSSEAEKIARRDVAANLEIPAAGPLSARSSTLMVFRSGLVRRVPGRDHLVYRVEIADGRGVREFVFVDAHTGKIVDRITGSHSALHRTIHEPDLNSVVIWNEGDALPYSTGDAGNDDQVNALIGMTETVYDFYLNLSGGTFPGWDGADGVMHSVWNASFVNCPNASWNGASTNYCDGSGADDVIAHEWTHAYTESTHGLIYQWQPGALNEAYSDIFGEILDKVDSLGTDTPVPVRTAGDCSTFGGTPPPSLNVLGPVSIAGFYGVGGAAFNPAAPATATAPVEQADDGAGATDGCAALSGFTPGRIALIDRGSCPFTDKVVNAQNVGAVGVIVVNSSDSVFTMSGSDGSITIPSVMVSSSDGVKIGNEVETGVGATIDLAVSAAVSVRWMVGEDAFGLNGPIRDMWNPTCKGDPDRVSAVQYWCSTADHGGVHTNSGVPNHAFALLVDGGTFNGHSVASLGWVKAAHLYWRAMTVYQVPDSDFADHEIALAQSCTDLIGIVLDDPATGLPAGQIDAADCAGVTEAMLAVEMGAEPPCNFQPLLAPGPPDPGCGALSLFDDFETVVPGWSLTNAGVFAEYSPRDWVRTDVVPEGGDGFAYFGIDSLTIGNCVEGDDDQSGTMSLDSPTITLGGAPSLVFDHYVATESGFDGGNLKISVNGGAYQPVAGADFTFNPYNTTLEVDNNTNPMGGQEAFSGSDGGVVASTWGQSQASLSNYAGAGDTIRLRFELGVDGCNGLDGWYLDNVRVCTDEEGAGDATALNLGLLAGGDIDMTWGDSCAASDTDYEVYEGALGDFTTHTSTTCSTGGATAAQVTPNSGDRYYLVVPRNTTREGSYGKESAGGERPAAGSACLPQAIAYECF